jgi:hypothetical protein
MENFYFLKDMFEISGTRLQKFSFFHLNNITFVSTVCLKNKCLLYFRRLC